MSGAIFHALRILPLKFLSRFVGSVVHARRPRFLAALLKRLLIRVLRIDATEAELPVAAYPSFGDFFSRRLKTGVRPVAEAFMVSPSDGLLLNHGVIESGMLLQCKGRSYPLEALMNEPGYAKNFTGGGYLTIYLSPRNYHRVHCPVDGVLESSCYVPGTLLPVNRLGLENASGLYCGNERWTGCLRTELGLLAILMVGSLNVGRLRLEKVAGLTNSPGSLPPPGLRPHAPGIALRKGDPYGAFLMGSTVILLCCERLRRSLDWDCLAAGELRMGMKLLDVKSAGRDGRTGAEEVEKPQRRI